MPKSDIQIRVQFGLAWNADGDIDYSFTGDQDIDTHEAFHAITQHSNEPAFSANVDFTMSDEFDPEETRVIKLWIDPEGVPQLNPEAERKELECTLAWTVIDGELYLAIGRDNGCAQDNLREVLHEQLGADTNGSHEDTDTKFALLRIDVPVPPDVMQVVLQE